MIGFENKKYDGILRHQFSGCEKITAFNSQAGQDLFALSILDGKKDGIFLDIGCNEPKRINNTLLLEEEYNWKGILIDFADYHVEACKNSRTKNSMYICDDATKVDYVKAFSDFKMPHVIDYMSLDIDGIETLHTLKNLPLESHKIRVITFEHDSYRFGDLVKKESREYLLSLGYILLCSDVKNGGCEYEDWYVFPELVDPIISQKFLCKNKEWSEIVFL